MLSLKYFSFVRWLNASENSNMSTCSHLKHVQTVGLYPNHHLTKAPFKWLQNNVFVVISAIFTCTMMGQARNILAFDYRSTCVSWLHGLSCVCLEHHLCTSSETDTLSWSVSFCVYSVLSQFCSLPQSLFSLFSSTPFTGVISLSCLHSPITLLCV